MLTKPVNLMDQASGCNFDVDKRILPIQQHGKQLQKIQQLIAQVESLSLKETNKNTANAQLIEMFCSKSCSRSFGDSFSSKFKNNETEEKKDEKSATEHKHTEQSREGNTQRGKQER